MNEPLYVDRLKRLYSGESLESVYSPLLKSPTDSGAVFNCQDIYKLLNVLMIKRFFYDDLLNKAIADGDKESERDNGQAAATVSICIISFLDELLGIRQAQEKRV